MKKTNSIVIITILVLLVLGLTGYIIYSNLNDDALDVSGTYYNSDYNDIYFTLKSDGTADVVSPSCSDGPLPLRTVSYKVSKENDVIVLKIDINNNQDYGAIYNGTLDESGNYRFKPLIFDCTEDENTYYLKK